MSQLALARGGVYRTLSMIYIERPNQSLLRRLAAERQLLSTAPLGFSGVLPDRLVGGLEAVRSFLKELDLSLIGKHADALSIEYTRLLRGVRHSYGPPPPYESVYAGEGIVFGETTMAVSREYQESGFTWAEHRGEPPDHISFELHFMQLMCTTEAEAWCKGDQDEALRLLNAEKHFLAEHLARWVSRFCENVRKYAKLGFYRGWADITEGWISFDFQQIDDYKASMSADRVHISS